MPKMSRTSGKSLFNYNFPSTDRFNTVDAAQIEALQVIAQMILDLTDLIDVKLP